MSPRDWRDRIEDMLVCAQNILEFTDGMNFDAFLDDPRTIRAVAFELTTIGEAARAVPAEIQDKYPNVPWGKMQGIRNVLVHEYFRIDEEILWKAARENMPQLIEALLELKK